MKTLSVILLIVAAFCLGALYSAGALKGATLSGPNGIHWESSLNNSLKKAQTSKKPLFVDFYADWCGYCKEMDRTTYRDPAVISLTRRFVCVRINVDKQEALTQKFGVDGLPTLLFLDPSGNEKKRIEGLVPTKHLLAVMNHVLQK